MFLIFLQGEEGIIGKVGVLLMAKTNLSKPYSEEWLPVKQILNGMIQTDDGYFVTGVKVMPKNIFMLEKNVQNNIIYNLDYCINCIII